MTHDPRIEPLLEWNRLAKENTENAMVSSMFEAGGKASEPVEKFSTWLLIGTAAVASFLITNSNKAIPLLGTKGFSVCGAFLCISCVFGLVSKMFALRVTIASESGAAIRQTFYDHLAKYEIEVIKINKSAEFWGINLQTGIDIKRVLTEFYKPLPKWVTWLSTKQLTTHAGNPQIGYLPIIRCLNWQCYCSFVQALGFLFFLISGFSYAAAT